MVAQVPHFMIERETPPNMDAFLEGFIITHDNDVIGC